MCTNLSLPRNSDSDPLITARSMDFGESYTPKITVCPRGNSFPQGGVQPLTHAYTWKNTAGFVSISLAGVPGRWDGMNEFGLSVAALWLPDTKYQETYTEADTNILDLEFVAWALGQFSSIDDMLNGVNSDGAKVPSLTEIHVVAEGGVMNKLSPIHFIIQDTSKPSQGSSTNCIVVSFQGDEGKTYGRLTTFENVSAGVLTNFPPYAKQQENLEKYNNLTPVNHKKEANAPQEVNGSGMLGMPGDSTPESRFVMANKLCMTGYRPDPSSPDLKAGIQFALQMIGKLEVPMGTVMSHDDPADKTKWDHTQWGVVRDHENLVYYLYEANDRGLRKIVLSELKLSSTGTITEHDVPPVDWFTDISGTLVPSS